VMRISASSGPTSGTGFSSSTMRPGSTNMAAFILVIGLLRRDHDQKLRPIQVTARALQRTSHLTAFKGMTEINPVSAPVRPCDTIHAPRPLPKRPALTWIKARLLRETSYRKATFLNGVGTDGAQSTWQTQQSSGEHSRTPF